MREAVQIHPERHVSFFPSLKGLQAPVITVVVWDAGRLLARHQIGSRICPLEVEAENDRLGLGSGADATCVSPETQPRLRLAVEQGRGARCQMRPRNDGLARGLLGLPSGSMSSRNNVLN